MKSLLLLIELVLLLSLLHRPTLMLGDLQKTTSKNNLKKIQILTHLQEEEKRLGLTRLAEIEKIITDLEERKTELYLKIQLEEHSIRKALIDLMRSEQRLPSPLFLPQSEKIEAPLRKMLTLGVSRSLKEIHFYQNDLKDAQKLEEKIHDEKQNLASLLQDLKEQAGILALNRQSEINLLQLERYRTLKNSEKAIERMIETFNIRKELTRISQENKGGPFKKLKGSLPLPLNGQVISHFGRTLDLKSNLYVFKKGIEISPTHHLEKVQAIFSGTIVFTGEVPSYGKVTLIDHGEHFYSLYGRLGEMHKRFGEKVQAGETIGHTNDAGDPIYFEIRARNLAVNPLQWLSN